MVFQSKYCNTDNPQEVQLLLQLEEGFGMPINKNIFGKTSIEFIKDIENDISDRPDNIVSFTRNNSVSILNRFSRGLFCVSSSDLSYCLFGLILLTNFFLRITMNCWLLELTRAMSWWSS